MFKPMDDISMFAQQLHHQVNGNKKGHMNCGDIP
jgi:hypothetical protein